MLPVSVCVATSQYVLRRARSMDYILHADYIIARMARRQIPCLVSLERLTLLGPQSRFGDKLLII